MGNAMFASLLLTLLSAVPAPTDTAANDARLSDICFVDARHGWAVGDRGVIWSTNDGGRQWDLQPSGVTCSLAAVCFLNDQMGWAAGGRTHPYTHASTGVLLVTRNGGNTWTDNPKLGLPALRRLGFRDPRHGWAVGCPSAMYPSGVFLTDDGGRQWSPLPGNRRPGWLAADFLDSHTGALAGHGGSLARVNRGEIEASRLASFALRNFIQLRLVPPNYGWLVGDGGLVQITTNLGAAWQAPPCELPRAAAQFDFAALAVRGPKCWIAGTPGTRVFHTADAGGAWNSFATGSTVPLRALWFVDDQHGWAAGDLGTILATDDGGQTWQLQRAGGRRAALLGLFADPDDVPLELIARLAGNEGYLAVIDVLGRRDVEIPPRDHVHLADRLHEAVVRVGGCGAEMAWRFPLRQAGLRLSQRQIVEAWDRANDGRAAEELQAYLVRQIRLWRPEVIVTHDASREGDDLLLALVHQAVLRAVAQAADANAFPNQMAEAGLEPWSVKKVLGAMPPDVRGGAKLVTSQFATRLGRSLADAAAEPRGLLRDHFSRSPPILGFRVLVGAAPQQDRRDFFGGIVLSPGGPARRELPPTAGAGLDLRQRIAQQRRHVQAILDRLQRTAGSTEHVLAQIDGLTRDLDDDGRGQVLYQLADGYYRTSRWALAAEAFQVLSERYPQHPLAPQAMLWRLQYYASAEAAWRVERGDRQKRLEYAVALGQQIERTRPEWFAEPTVFFPLAAAHRGLGQTRQAQRIYQSQSHGGDGDAWTACALGELHQAEKGASSHLGEAPLGPFRQMGTGPFFRRKPVLTCVKAEEKPHLDGRLDDPLWRQAKPAALHSAQHDDGDWPAEVMLAHDAEFLYLAARCRQPPGQAPDGEIGDESRPRQRPRDADLSDQDRIEVLLDVDRDFTTYYRLAIDCRGWTNDRCWGDATWDPKWFVAAGREGDVWTVEAAIPLVELVDHPPPPGSAWTVGVQRVVPGVGFQSWTAPAAISVLPEGFGYLVFP